MKYSSNFYRAVSERNSTAAKIAAGQIADLYKFESLIDVGSGQGNWTKSFLNTLSTLNHVTAIDLDANNISIQNNENEVPTRLDFSLISQDLSKNPFLPTGSYDLGICVEVLEHIELRSAEILIQEFGRKVLFLIFSAAVPGQGGTHHVNEQPLKYWENKLRNVGFEPFDLFRMKLNNESSVPKYYANNLVFWIRKDALESLDLSQTQSLLSKLSAIPLVDTRSIKTKFVHKIVALLPIRLVTLIAEMKSKIIS